MTTPYAGLIERLLSSAKAYHGMLHDSHADDCVEAAEALSRLTRDVEELRGMLSGAQLQLEYLDERFPTGTTPAVVARIDATLTRLSRMDIKEEAE